MAKMKKYRVQQLHAGSNRKHDEDRVILATNDIAEARSKMEQSRSYYIQYMYPDKEEVEGVSTKGRLSRQTRDLSPLSGRATRWKSRVR